MNIFCLYNVLWGLARMGCRKEDLSSSIANRLLTKTIDILHTFLPIHYGDVIWLLAHLLTYLLTHSLTYLLTRLLVSCSLNYLPTYLLTY